MFISIILPEVTEPEKPTGVVATPSMTNGHHQNGSSSSSGGEHSYHQNGHYTNEHSHKSEVKLNEIVTELNSHYQTYSEMKLRQHQQPAPSIQKPVGSSVDMQPQHQQQLQTPTLASTKLKQIHVFITGLNTCPTYCHVCQQIIPLIAYASKCQLCSFTCHSTCSNAR